MSELIYPRESYAIIGACFAVYNDKGCGFLEPVYQECLEIEFEYQAVPFEAQKELRLEYRGAELRQRYMPDFVCHDKIILEIKAVSRLTDEHRSQVLNYLHATGMNEAGHPRELRPLPAAGVRTHCPDEEKTSARESRK